MNKQLTVAELIHQLQQYPPGYRVLVDGYEIGFEDPQISIELAVPLAAPFDWEGEYISATYGGRTVGSPFKAVIIGRDKTGEQYA